eukprot:2438996-Pleurochrysis_carterae.AAC.2
MPVTTHNTRQSICRCPELVPEQAAASPCSRTAIRILLCLLQTPEIAYKSHSACLKKHGSVSGNRRHWLSSFQCPESIPAKPATGGVTATRDQHRQNKHKQAKSCTAKCALKRLPRHFK